jgi:DNA-binding LacI/PurR family transcriptional regulator
MAIHDILAKNGIKVPDDVSLASFDNIDASQYFVVPLTTMGMDFYEMSRRAAKILFSRKEGSAPSGMFIQNRVSPKLVPRDSIKKIKI